MTLQSELRNEGLRIATQEEAGWYWGSQDGEKYWVTTDELNIDERKDMYEELVKIYNKLEGIQEHLEEAGESKISKSVEATFNHLRTARFELAKTL